MVWERIWPVSLNTLLDFFNALIKVKAKTIYLLNSEYFYFKLILVSQRKIKYLPTYSLLSIRSILFLPSKCCYFLAEVCKSCLQEGSLCIYSREEKVHQQTGHLLPFSLFDRRTFGLTVWQLIKIWPGADERQGALHIKVSPPRTSQKDIEIKDCYYTTNLHSKTTKLPFFSSQHGLFLQSISTVIWGCMCCREYVLRDLEHYPGLRLQSLKLWIFIKHGCCITKQW